MATSIDVTREHCPMTFVKVKLALAKLRPGETLEVLLLEGEPLENVPRSAREQGHEILEQGPLNGGVHRVVLRKGA
jgi:TusA-related sulfurtransferase